MKYQEALIAWTPGISLVRVDHIMPSYDQPDWTGHPVLYADTGGAAYSGLR